MPYQHPYGLRVQSYRPATGGAFRRADYDLSIGVHPLLRHRQFRGVQVDVRPTQTGQLTSVQAP
ncbi:hypothetical protein AB0H88_14600 [Nonomuraea sp. NPDC050680]|uniref:hypothetical protein n=1 Tax=Nonomuraea sp. NPDC050680 TaxID=3154630 RepID=UPI0033CE8AFF